MDAKKLQADLQRIESEYFAADEDKAAAIAAMDDLHHGVWNDAQAATAFRRATLTVCGGAYIPSAFWPELATFAKDQSNRDFLFAAIQALVDSDFDDEMLARIKPFLVVYFAAEKQFELDKLKAFIIDKAHPRVREYFDKMTQFVTKNPASVQTYQRKFGLLKNHFPDFELFGQPVARLEEQVA
jgi:hypothetical protein